MNTINSIKNLTSFEKKLWIFSVAIVTVSYLAVGVHGTLSLIASLIGASALIFIAKGDVLGQILTVVFSLLYAIISFKTKYYGEMITYLGMTMPIAILSVISWLKNPYSDTEVKISHLTFKKIIMLLILTIITTWIFYYILKHFNTANLLVSTISISTSFLAASLMLIRSPYYAAFYGLNDIVLIVLWAMATIKEISFLPMVVCFLMFLINDIYGLINWLNMEKKQHQDL